MNINFPNLGIYLAEVGKNISIGNFDIAYYGIVIGIGMLAGLLLAEVMAKKTGQNSEIYYDLAISGIIFGLIGARIYYVAFSWDKYKDNLLSIFNVREGGLAIYGGIIAAVITCYVLCRIKKAKMSVVADTACLGLITGQIFGRWGNFFNREAFGDYTNGLFAMQLPVSAVRNADITDKLRENIVNLNGIDYIQVHPTFLYESTWNLMVLIGLILYTKHKKFDGEILLLYLFFYGLGRILIEALRTDQLTIGNTGIAISQVVAGICMLLSVALIVFNRIKASKTTVEEKSE